MSSSPGPFMFNVEFVTEHRVKKWWQDSLIGDVIFTPLVRDGQLSKATHYSCNVGDPTPITSLRDLTEASATWRDMTVVSIYAGASEAPSWQLSLKPDTTGPIITLRIDQDPDGSVREQFAGWVDEWSRGLAANDLHVQVGFVAPYNRPYPRPRPPRTGTTWPLGNLDLYLGRQWHSENDTRKAVFQRIREAALAPGMRRVDIGDGIMRVSVDCDLSDEASVQRARALSETWLTPLVPTELKRGWNDAGDEMVIPTKPVEREPFTFFDTYQDRNIGYWALVRDPDDGSVDEDRWQRLAAIARAGALPDGTPVRSIRLIAPVRDEALALLERATADGFEMVTYPGGNRVFWRVYPPDSGN